jgi:uncharacterized protein YggU (UPF0235/DUF167 family)
MEIIASALGVPKTSVSVVRGQSARHKILDVGEISRDAIVAAFGQPDEALF